MILIIDSFGKLYDTRFKSLLIVAIENVTGKEKLAIMTINSIQT
jgi:DNA replication protein DnaC